MVIVPCITLVTATSLAGCAVVRHRHVRHLDWLFFCATAPFALLALLDLLGRVGYLSGLPLLLATRLAYQCVILGITAFIMALLRARQQRFYRWLFALQASLGVVLALWPLDAFPALRLPLWQAFNIAVVGIFVLILTFKLSRRGGTRAWFVLLAAVTALGVMVGDLVGPIGEPIDASWAQLFLMPILLLLWLVATRRVKFFVPSTAARRAARRRQLQLAQDLHDGVGSQLASIISALNVGTDHERAIATRLHECLVELKLLVDGEDDDLSLPALLASLRYRMEPLLVSMGIRLVWNLVPHEELEAIRNSRARHVLRIAQEALANVVQHAKADTVSVTCVYRSREHALLLEVIDNGVSLPYPARGRPDERQFLGKGIHGMYERAELLGGELTIEPTSGHSGTRVTLVVPLGALEPTDK